MSKKIPIGADHAGFKLKQELISFLKEKGYEPLDEGTYSEERADYPDFGHAVARVIQEGRAERGILMCGSGNGIAMSANKHPGIRAALCWNSEIAQLARAHNDANILVLPARYMSDLEARVCVETFLNTEFEGGRHTQRISKIDLK
jgi:ribose 5-phosphate isomerase B